MQGGFLRGGIPVMLRDPYKKRIAAIKYVTATEREMWHFFSIEEGSYNLNP